VADFDDLRIRPARDHHEALTRCATATATAITAATATAVGAPRAAISLKEHRRLLGALVLHRACSRVLVALLAFMAPRVTRLVDITASFDPPPPLTDTLGTFADARLQPGGAGCSLLVYPHLCSRFPSCLVDEWQGGVDAR